jgi:2-iminoacetate synthase
MRRATFELGVSQISAGSRTNPGGYAESGGEASGQFSLGDHRGLDEVVKDIAGLGYVPSFCTACYRLGRTGADFMDLARPGDIKTHCGPNALATFQEYLDDYGAEDTKEAGERTIAQAIADLATQDPKLAGRAERMVRAVKSGKRDVFC